MSSKRIFISSGISQIVDMVWPLCVLLKEGDGTEHGQEVLNGHKLDTALPPSVLQGPGLDDRYGPQGLVAEYFHRELRVLTTLMVPCLHMSQHKSTAMSCHDS